MVELSNEKSKKNLVILLKTGVDVHKMCFSSDDIMTRPILEIIEIVKSKIEPGYLGLNRLQRLKVINHIVGSLHDYHRFLKNEK